MEGILVGCDQQQEWLLPWWWKHYSKYNSYPVAFFNFGMSETASAWCREKGQYIDLLNKSDFLKPVSAENQELWEATLGERIWSFRASWFKKPLACLHSPFALSCWIDLDCEIRGPLSFLFDSLGTKTEIALVKNPVTGRTWNFPNEITYNSGVIVFRQGAKIIQRWAEAALKRNHQFMGDQDVLSREIYLHEPFLFELPEIYNWCNWGSRLEPSRETVILHYVGAFKEILKDL